MSRERHGCEFDDQVIIEALEATNWHCECCGLPQEEVGPLRFHHRLPIAIALTEYPQISVELLRSSKNLEVVCKKCHKKEDKVSQLNHGRIALLLLLSDRLNIEPHRIHKPYLSNNQAY